jgi:hypothetical protein
MFRQSGLREQWRDMARSTESARQLVENDELAKYSDEIGGVPLKRVYNAMEHNIRALMAYLGADSDEKSIDQTAPGLEGNSGDVCGADPAVTGPRNRIGLRLMHALERNYAEFAKVLLEYVLIPHWKKESQGFVQSEAPKSATEEGKPSAQGGDIKTPNFVLLAEEFVAIRYLSVIRTVLVNLRYLMTFVTAAFVLGIVAWNSYPFEPRDLVNWLFTILLVLLGVCIVVVFAQMHRDSILSRITDKRPNELGWDFYLRVASFGALPVLTWLAYNHPQIGVTLYQLFQSGGGAK